MKLIVHDAAARDLEEQAAYIAHHDAATGRRFLESARTTMLGLLRMPQKGRRRPMRDAALEDLRSYPVRGFANHLIFYRVLENEVEVIRVLHGARDIDPILEE
jgi:toxin ParE1/3/4